ncbi:MAG: decarboxylating 6-phosphogluconate dehydrogenase [Gemmatimonadota bacterium]|nr:decarboxylating 6-phosphogluconate dehydrogenase [Gemmatimonadota bacterium]
MEIGMIGLGRMGANMVRRLMRGGHRCAAFDRSADAVNALVKEGAIGVHSQQELINALATPRVLWMMVPAAFVDASIDSLAPLLSPGDIIIDGGNSNYQDDIARAGRLKSANIHYVDAGVSGGVFGLERGYCLMIGGEKDIVDHLEPIFKTLAPGAGTIPPTPGRGDKAGTSPEGYLHCGATGAGHFVKMVHNAIEYGLMAAYAEGFNILKHANAGLKKNLENDAETTPLRQPDHYQYEFDVGEIAELWRRGSVIPSWLLDLSAAAMVNDSNLNEFDGHVSDSGEGRWSLSAANDLAVPVHVLSAALFERFASRGEADFQNRLLSALRFQFGGHTEKPKS